MALLVGGIVLIDLRSLGFGLRNQSAAELTRRFKPWTHAGLAIVLLTGPILFSADVPRYLHNPAFLVKVVFLLLALASHFTVHRSGSRFSAVLSLLLWSCVIIGGRAIADFDA